MVSLSCMSRKGRLSLLAVSSVGPATCAKVTEAGQHQSAVQLNANATICLQNSFYFCGWPQTNEINDCVTIVFHFFIPPHLCHTSVLHILYGSADLMFFPSVDCWVCFLFSHDVQSFDALGPQITFSGG